LVRHPPGLFQHPQPISEAYLLDQRLAESALAHGPDQILQAGGGPYSRWHPGAIEIRAQSDAILAKMFEHVCEVLYDELNGRIGVSSPVGTQKAGGKIDADQATGLTNCRQLLVGEISRMRAQDMRVGMSRDEWGVADGGHIPEPTFIDVRQIDQNVAYCIVGPTPCRGPSNPGQYWAKMGRETGRRARTHWAYSRRVREIAGQPHTTRRGIRNLRRWLLRLRCEGQVPGRPRSCIVGYGRCRIDGRGYRRIDSYVWRGCIARRTARSAGRRDENRKQPSGEPSLERLRKIHVTLGLSIEERLRPISAATLVQTSWLRGNGLRFWAASTLP
jgi:hypothetical protein